MSQHRYNHNASSDLAFLFDLMTSGSRSMIKGIPFHVISGGDGFMKAEAVADDQFPDYLFETVIPIGQLVNFNWLSAPMALMK